jgi:hypothetical protein
MFENGQGTREQEWIIAKITKRVVDAPQPDENRDVFAWDKELRGFGVRPA